MPRLLPVTLLIGLMLSALTARAASVSCKPARVDVGGLRAVMFPPDLPVIDIVAEHSWSNTSEEAAAMRRVHAAFVAASPAREAVFASDCSHYVMRDRPELVIDAIKRMIERAGSVVRQLTPTRQ